MVLSSFSLFFLPLRQGTASLYFKGNPGNHAQSGESGTFRPSDSDHPIIHGVPQSPSTVAWEYQYSIYPVLARMGTGNVGFGNVRTPRNSDIECTAGVA